MVQRLFAPWLQGSITPGNQQAALHSCPKDPMFYSGLAMNCPVTAGGFIFG